MQWLPTETALLDAAAATVGFAVNWLVQSTLLIVAGLAIGRLLLQRGSAVQSVVYRTTFVAALVCPLATGLLSLAGVPGWSIPMPQAWTMETAEAAALRETAVSAPLPVPVAPAEGATADMMAPSPTQAPPVGEMFPPPQYTFNTLPAESALEPPAADAPPVVEEAVAESIDAQQPTMTEILSVRAFGYIAAAIGVVWLLISMVLTARLAIAWWRLVRLRRGAVPADAVITRTCDELASRLDVRSPPVLRSPFLPSPCLAGLSRPAVLLPEVALRLSLRDVLIHELAHLRRRDCHWNLLRQLASALFFFQPLLWVLSRRLEATAEEVCDDYVMQLGGDRHAYAHRLVDIAELSVAQYAAAGVGIVSLRSMLAQRVARIMDSSRTLSTRVGSLLLLLVLAGGLVGTIAVGLVGLGPRTTQADAEPMAAEDAELADDEPIVIRGTVVDTRGAPVAGATVRLVRWYWDPEINRLPLNESQSDAEGRFEISYRKSQFDKDVRRPEQWKEVAVAAFKPGYGPDWAWWDEIPPDETARLQLPDDNQPVVGRLVDLEGQPLAGVKVKIGSFAAPAGDDMSDWLEAVENGAPPWVAVEHLRQSSLPFEGTGLPDEVVTDANGKFRLTGVGSERKFSVVFERPTIARTEATIVTRKMERLNQVQTTNPDFAANRTEPIFGAEFELALSPTRVIEGVVRDAATGDPMAAVGVYSWQFAGTRVIGQRQIHTETDELGRFRLAGMPKEPGNEIIAVPGDGQPYFMQVAEVPDAPGMKPATVDFELHRGIWITGRVTNKATAEPVPFAKLYYLPFLTNEYAQVLPEFDSNGNVDGTNAYQNRYQTAQDGTYRLVGLPGRAIVGVKAVYGEFRQGLGADKIEGMSDHGHFDTFRNPVNPSHKWPTAMTEINPALGTEQIELDFELDPGRSVEIAMHDPAGEPLTGVSVVGVTSSGSEKTIDDTSLTAVAFGPQEERTVLFRHDGRKLGKAIRLRAEDLDERIQVTLQPCVTIKGRLVDQNDAPVTGAEIRVAVLPSEDFRRELRRISTDADGRFEHADVLPGAKYSVMVESARTGFTTVVKDLAVQPGETIDLGTIDVTSDDRPEMMRTPAVAMPEVQADDVWTVRGRVVDPTGQPVAGADVLALGYYVNRGVENPLAEAKTDGAGGFEISYRKSQFVVDPRRDRSQDALIAAFADGFAPVWSAYRELPNPDDAELRLVADVPIEGRIVDLEGRPVAGAKVAVGKLQKPTSGNLDEWLEAVRAGQARGMSDEAFGIQIYALHTTIAGRMPEVTTDDDGRFRLTGVGRERLAEVRLAGPTIVKQRLRVATRDIEPITQPAFSGPDANSVTNYGLRFELAAAPSRPIEGVARDAETGEPLAGVRIWSDRLAGSSMSNTREISTTTDENGRYRLEGMPKGEGNRIIVVPSDLPYFATRFDVPDPAGIEPVALDLPLNRGTWVAGRVTDAVTGRGVSARLYYLACPDNKQAAELPEIQDGRHVEIEPDRYQTDADGNFRVVALPGRGLVAVECRDTVYRVRQGYDAVSDLAGSLFGLANHLGYRKYNGAWTPTKRDYTAVKEVHVEMPDQAVTCDFALEHDADRRVALRLVDPTGAEVTGAVVAGMLEQSNRRRDVSTADVELLAFREDETRTVLIRHDQRRLGKALQVNAADGRKTVTLEPLATVRGRLVNDDEPIAAAELRFDAKSSGNRLVHLDEITTDADGRFAHKDVLAGLPYTICVQGANIKFTVVARDVEVQPGETVDLGTIDVQPGTMRPKTAADQESSSDVYTIRGRVVDADDQPVAGATIRLPDDVSTRGRTMLSDADGRFEIVMDKSRFTTPDWHPEPWRQANLIAAKPGYGFAWVRGQELETDRNPVLRLPPDDVPIRGQVLDLEGRPVPNARFVIWDLHDPHDGNLDGLFDELSGSPVGTTLQTYVNQQTTSLHARNWQPQVARGTLGRDGQKGFPIVTADDEGHFEITGIGPERVVRGRIEGPNIQSMEVYLVTRTEIDESWKNQALNEMTQSMLDSGDQLAQLYAAGFQLFAAPSMPISGIVRDRETGQPIAGVGVSGGTSGAGDHQFGQSDENGRFELTGIGTQGTLRLQVGPQDGTELPYIGIRRNMKMSAETPDGSTDFELTRGILVRGRVTDAETQKPVKARVLYLGWADNPHLEDLTDELWHYADEITDENGDFAIAVLPGPGALAVEMPLSGDYQDRYRPASYKEFGLPPTERGDIATVNRGLIHAEQFKAAHHIDFKPGETPAPIFLTVKPVTEVARVRCVDEAGRLVRGVSVAGRLPWEHNFRPIPISGLETGRGDRAYIEIADLDAETRRPVVFIDYDNNLAAVLFPNHSRHQPRLADLPQDEDGVSRITLHPGGKITGRLVDADGAPARGAGIELHLAAGPILRQSSIEVSEARVDIDGRFELTHVPAGGPYLIGGGGPSYPGRLIRQDLQVAAGETVDLGAIDITNRDGPPAVQETATVKMKPADDAREFAGTVVDPDGQPVARADVYFLFHVPQATGLLTADGKPITTTDAAGKFRFAARPADFGANATASEFAYASVAAVTDGFGFAWERAATDGETTLRLVDDDEPIRGRIVDIDGQPVEGAQLTLLEVWAGPEDDLTAWREAAGQPQADYYSARTKAPQVINNALVRSLVRPATTDADGRFMLRGVGHGRIAQLLVEGPGIATVKIFARTEPGEPIELMRQRSMPDLGTYIYHPAELTLVAGPSTPVTGFVRDAQTGQPLPGITVKSQRRAGERISGWGQDFVRAVTDDAGHYWLEGMPVGDGNVLAAIAPEGDIAYMSFSQRAEVEAAGKPLELDFDLPRGVWIEGRITDQRTGEGLSGHLDYYAQEGNPHYQRGVAGTDERDRLLVDNDGRFRVAVIPGPGYLTFNADDHQNYPRATQIVKPDGTREKVPASMLQTRPSLLVPSNCHLIAELDPAVDAERVELNLQLDPGNRLVGKVIGPDGQPVTGAYYSGKLAEFATWSRTTGDAIELLGYDAVAPRHVYVMHTARNLAGHLTVEGEHDHELVVRLQPAGSVKGRLVDQDGAPLGNCRLVEWHPPIRNDEDLQRAYAHHAPPLPRNTAHSTSGRYETDEQGRFEISHLVPGIRYLVRGTDQSGMTPARGRIPRFSGPLDAVIQVEPGENKDLGDVRLADDAEFAKRVAAGEPTAASKPDGPALTVAGRVNDASGQPVANVHLAVVAHRIQTRRGGEFAPWGEVLAEAETDANGQFAIRLKGVSSKTHQYQQLIARKEGSAIAWHRLNLDSPPEDVSLELRDEELIRGRLVDIEGQPAAGVRLSTRFIIKQAVDGVQTDEGAGYDGEEQPAAWLPSVVSDDEGRFELHGVPAGFGAFLEVDGDDRFAPQEISLNTGMPEQRGERDATYRSLVKNVGPGEEAVLPLAPAQLFEGTVTYEDTGEPAPHARLTIWASQQELGSMTSVAGEADAEGRYHINPRPGIRFGVTAYPPDGTPYLARQTPLEKSIRWQPGDRVRKVDVSLPRGVLVTGKIVEAEAETPVVGASVQYRPESLNNPNTADDILTGWKAIQVSNNRGEFELAVLPGPGRLFVHGRPNEYVIQETTSNQIYRGSPGGNRQYAHYIERIDVTADQSPVEMSIELQRGGTVRGTLVDESGDSVDEAIMVSWRNLRPVDLEWRGHSPDVIGGRFEMGGLVEGQEYAVHFLAAKRKLGATAMISTDEPSPRVVLKPCGAAVMRLVDELGEPVANLSAVNVYLLARPGVDQYDRDAMRAGAVGADSDFISNVDGVNYPHVRSTDTDNEGRLSLPVLIPGATYRIVTLKDGKFTVAKNFTVDAGETLDLGDLVVDVVDE